MIFAVGKFNYFLSCLVSYKPGGSNAISGLLYESCLFSVLQGCFEKGTIETLASGYFCGTLVFHLYILGPRIRPKMTNSSIKSHCTIATTAHDTYIFRRRVQQRFEEL